MLEKFRTLLSDKKEVQEDEFPDGWIEVKLTRRFVNPKWDAIQYVKQGLIQQYLQNIPEEAREEQLMAIALQVEAQFAALEAQTDRFEEEEQVLYIASPDENPQLAAEYEKFRGLLGLGKKAMARPPKPAQEEIITVEAPKEVSDALFASA